MQTKYFIFLSIYLVFTIIIQIVLVRNTNFAIRQKRIHSVLLWLIPFLWGILLITSQRVLSKKVSTDKRNEHDSEYKDSADVANIGGFHSI